MLDEQQIRREKLKKIKESGINPYPSKFNKEDPVIGIKEAEDDTKLKTAGRILITRVMGKLCFAHIEDFSGKAQIAIKADEVGKEQFKFFTNHFDPGDFIGVAGEVFTTHKGEKTLLVKKFELLSKALLPLPEKWHGLKDEEERLRKRYLDMIANPEVKEMIVKKA
ncbi:MAG TPA: OB-fold nucleic acid binding domain-containing protein, partial [Patescibacteria group bacterium]|nr:OB-fold nucleic acid binding domain-containing protein [Patescibacteria group bacterium]